jgi:hypothetical protein
VEKVVCFKVIRGRLFDRSNDGMLKHLNSKGIIMSRKCIYACLAVIALLFVSCSPIGDHQIVGKWLIAGRIVGSSPTSYWFKKNGSVIAPWEKHKTAFRSSGKFEFIDKNHIKIIMNKGHFRGVTFFFEIVTLDEEKLVLRGSIQDIRMRRVE